MMPGVLLPEWLLAGPDPWVGGLHVRGPAVFSSCSPIYIPLTSLSAQILTCDFLINKTDIKLNRNSLTSDYSESLSETRIS